MEGIMIWQCERQNIKQEFSCYSEAIPVEAVSLAFNFEWEDQMELVKSGKTV